MSPSRRFARLLAPALSLILTMCLTGRALAVNTYPPGPSNACLDSVRISSIQDSLAACHPVRLDLVKGVAGIITAFDAKPTGFSFYLQNSQGGPYSGIDVFTGGFNYAGAPYNLALGDSVSVTGTIQEFPNVAGETEIEGPDASQTTNDIVIRRISSGNALPPFRILSPGQASWIYNAAGGQGEMWEGTLVRVRGPLRVMYSALTPEGMIAGMPSFTFILAPVSDTANVLSRILVDGVTLTTFTPPAIGTVLDSVQGVFHQRVTSNISSYRLQLRDANDVFGAAPPNLMAARAISENQIQLEFDRSLDAASAANAANYQLSNFHAVTAATFDAGRPRFVTLTVGADHGMLVTVAAANVASNGCPACVMPTGQSRTFIMGVLSIAELQAADPSAYAGPGTAAGPVLTFEGTCTSVFGSLYYMQTEGGGVRTGVAAYAPIVPLQIGHRYRLSGEVLEFHGETEVSYNDYVEDLGAGVVPNPVVLTVPALVAAWEDYEGMLVSTRDARVTDAATLGQPFTIEGPYGAWGTPVAVGNLYGVLNAYDPPDSPQIVSVTGVGHQVDAANYIAPRSASDVFVDITPPQSQFTSGPADGAVLDSSRANFGFTATDDHSTLAELLHATSVDGGAYGAYTSATSRQLVGLSDAVHTLTVRSIDRTGNVDPTPATRTFTVHAIAPTLSFTSSPAEGSGTTETSASFAWALTSRSPLAPPDSMLYDWQLDGGAWTSLGHGSSVTLSGLTPAAHSFVARATDNAGLVGTLTRHWTVQSSDLVVADTVTIPGNASYHSIVVQSGGLLTANGLVTVETDVTIQSGGILTHGARNLTGLRVNMGGTLTVASGGLIDVTAKGLTGGTGAPTAGETYDASDAIVPGATATGGYGAGASYGGAGSAWQGATNAAYGLLEDPRHLGSGGGGSSGRAGASGGGLIRIAASKVVVEGFIRANGGAGSAGGTISGSGSGGAIRLEADTISGAGTIEARGGTNTYNGAQAGNGGGGRIAIYFGSMTLPQANVLATGGANFSPGSAGTVYLKQSDLPVGDLIVDNGNRSSSLTTSHRSALPVLRGITVRNRGGLRLRAGDAVFVSAPVTVRGTSHLTLDSLATLGASAGSDLVVDVQGLSSLTASRGSVFVPKRLRVNSSGALVTSHVNLAFPVASDLEISGGGALLMRTGTTLSLPSFDGANVSSGTVDIAADCRLQIAANALVVANGVTVVKDGTFGVSGELDELSAVTIQSGGTLTHSARHLTGLKLSVSGTLTVATGGLIDVTAKGLAGGSGAPGAGETYDATDAIVPGASGANGFGAAASYGGTGGAGQGPSNAPYGLLEDPRHLGSGGGGASGLAGANGGGLVRIAAGNLVVDGAIRANGGAGAAVATVGGSGSGGAIRVDAGSVSGSGTIEARGGTSGYASAQGTNGGGGRIAIYYDTLTLPQSNIRVYGGANLTPGSAGTVYLKQSSQPYGVLDVNNNNLASTLVTPLRTSLARVREVTLQNRAWLSLDAAKRVTAWADTLTLANATLSAADTIRLQGTTLRGNGTVATRLVNNAVVSPGTNASRVGQLVMAGGYVQGATGTCLADIASASSFDRLRSSGTTELDGHLGFALLDGYQPATNARFPVLSHGTRTGVFSSFAGGDPLASLSYGDTTTTLVPRDLLADHQRPATSLVSGPADSSWTNASPIAFSWTATDNLTPAGSMRYAYRLDGGIYSAITGATSVSYPSLTDGEHRFEVYAVDEAANADSIPDMRTFTVDRTLPVAAFAAAPAEGETLGVSTVLFTFGGTDNLVPAPQLTFAYSLDGAAYSAYSSVATRTLSGLADGEHHLSLRVRDLAGNTSATVIRSFRVESTAPALAFLSGPAADEHVPGTAQRFSWTATSTSTPVGALLYRWALDQAPSGAFARDTLVALNNLSATTHVLTVESKDRWEHVSSTARTFRVDTQAPIATISTGPAEGDFLPSASASFTWTGTDDATATNALQYSSRVDGSEWTAPALVTGRTVTGLSEGAHTFEVRAVDLAGNIQASPASRTFTVDLTAPETQVASGPAEGSTLFEDTATLGWTGSDDRTLPASLRFQNRLDGAAFGTVASAQTRTLTALADGTHTFEVRAVDLAGNADPSPATRTFVVDMFGPVVTWTSGPAENACLAVTNAAFTWSVSDAVTAPVAIECSWRLDDAPYSVFDSTRSATLPSLEQGVHTLTVQARDSGGHVTSVTRTFRIDTVAPVVAMPTTRVLDSSKIRVQCTAQDLSGATSFHVQISTDVSFATLAADVQIGAAGTYDFTGVPGSSYYARAQASDCAGNTSAFVGPSNIAVLANLPNLVVTSVTAAATATSGQVTAVDYTVRNTGVGPTSTPSWHEAVYLSPTPTFDAGTAILLGQRQNVTYLAPGESYSGSIVVTIPIGTSGARYMLVVSDVNGAVPESNGSDNMRASSAVAVTMGAIADLHVTEVVAPPTALSGEVVTVSWTVRNTGPGRTNQSQWWDTVFLSNDPNFDINLIAQNLDGANTIRVLDAPVAQALHTGALEPDSSYTRSVQVTLPSYFGGKRYFIVASDLNATAANQIVSERGSVFEDQHELNATAAESTEVTQQLPPDLLVDAFRVGTNAVSGGTVTVEFTVGNHGFEAIPGGSWTDQLWLSSDATLDGNDLLLGSYPRGGALPLGASYTTVANPTLPVGMSGVRYVFVKTDVYGQLYEYLDTNNARMSPQTLTVTLSPWTNLVPAGLSVSDTLPAGGSGTARWTVSNIGALPLSGASTDLIYLGTSSVWSPAMPIVGSLRESRGLAPGSSYEGVASIQVPVSYSGTYYAFVRVDGQNEVYEHTDEGDNVALIGAVIVKPYPAIDLAVSNVSVPSSASGGQGLSATYTVTNLGAGATLANWWAEEVWLSTDAIFSPATDVALVSPGHSGALAPGASYTRTVSGTVPPGLSGKYMLIVRTDPSGSSGDRTLANNTAISVDTTVAVPDTTVVPPGGIAVSSPPPPQLTVSGVAVDGALDAGQPALVSWQLHNVGAGGVPNAQWFSAVYLSQDPWLDGGDVSLGSLAGPATFAPGANATQQLTIMMPAWASGAYYVIVRTDSRNEVWEGGAEGDNANAAPTLLTLPPPSDLVVTDVQVPSLAIPGEMVSVSYTLLNQGTNPAVGQLQNAVYMSSDSLFVSEDDPLVGVEVVNINLAPGAAKRMMQRVAVRPMSVDQLGNVTSLLPPLSPGSYHAIVRANIRDNIRELDAANNDALSEGVVQTDMTALALEGPQPFSLTSGQSRFFKVTVPAEFDLKLQVSSSVPDATNEVFVAFDRAPDENEFDWSGPAGFTTNPAVLVPQTQAGTYYIMVTCRGLGTLASSENVTLLAQTLPFSLTSHSPGAGGSGGDVSVRVRGAGLRDTTVFRLEQSGIVKATSMLAKFVNSTDLITRFNLAGVPAGIYDLVAVNGANTVVVPAAFVVEPPRPIAVAIETDNADVLRRTAIAPFTVRLRNTSNQDAPIVQARVLIPGNSQVRSLELGADLHSWSRLVPGRQRLAGDVYMLHHADGSDSLWAVDVVGANLRPGEVRSFTIGVSGFSTSPYSLRVLAGAMTKPVYLNHRVAANEAARRRLLSSPSTGADSLVAAAADAFGFRDRALFETEATSGLLTTSEVEDYLYSIDHYFLPSPVDRTLPAGPQSLLDEVLAGGPCPEAAAIPECAPEVAIPGTALPACRVVFPTPDVAAPIGIGEGAVVAIGGTSVAGYTETASANARVVVPCDPNLITGPAGFGPEHWVRASAPMQYRIDFENMPGIASAPAQVVRISLPIDPSLDPATFRVGNMGFRGTNQIGVTAGRTTFTSQATYADLGLAVRVTAGIDPDSRVASWTFSTLDPVTGRAPVNPYIGFLPVNDLLGNGTGYVTFTIQPYADAPSGAAVREQASIRFDANAPVPTNTAQNRVDTRQPVSAALTSIELLDPTRVRVHWNGSDDSTGAGLATVTLYMKQDVGTFSPVAPPVSGSSLEVSVTPGHSFSFHTLAMDNVGNAEASKASAEAAVTVGTPQLEVDGGLPRVTMLHPNFPNPFRGATSLRFDLARAEMVTLDVFDVQGRLVSKPVDNRRMLAGTHTIELKGLSRGAGVYFYRLRAGQYEKTRRMVLIP